MLSSAFVLELVSADTPQYVEFVPALTAAYHALNTTPPPSKLIVNVAACNFLAPGHLVVLACLIEAYQQQNIGVELLVADNEVYRYLQQIRFFEYWNPGFNRQRFTHNELATNLCLWQVDAEMIDHYAHQAKLYFSQQVLPGKNLDVLSLNWAELFNNICDHSRSGVQGYCFTQHYPNRQQLVTAVCDFGIGIPASINKMRQTLQQPRWTDAEALQEALRRGVTTRSTPRNRGFGLDSLATSVKALGGELVFLSNFAQLTQTTSGKITADALPYYVPGTLIVVTLNTASLPDVETEQEADEFSF
ncbi:MAG: hypothetical protein EOO61_12675 [Hymenobacter sp.]|nr:MAG: hypothetical protein EOO61_12675 [Hymenobacter sp.]